MSDAGCPKSLSSSLGTAAATQSTQGSPIQSKKKRIDDIHGSPPSPQTAQRTRRLLGKNLRLDVTHSCLWWRAHAELGAVSKQAP